MSLLTTLRVSLASDNLGVIEGQNVSETRWTSTVVQRQDVSVGASGFTAITVPTGAKYVMILPGQAIKLTLKGITGDTGIPIAPTSGPLGAPLCLPLGSLSTFGIASTHTSAQVVTVLFR